MAALMKVMDKTDHNYTKILIFDTIAFMLLRSIFVAIRRQSMKIEQTFGKVSSDQAD